MTLPRRTLLAAGAGLLAAPAIVRAQGDVPIRIGEINSYTAIPSFTLPYRNGWQLAVEQVNERVSRHETLTSALRVLDESLTPAAARLTAARTIMRPSSRAARPRITVSTSGSSGMGGSQAIRVPA